MIPRLDRSEGRRDDSQRLAEALADSCSRFVIFDGDRALLRSDIVEPIVVDGEQLRTWSVSTESAVLLGFDGATAWFGLDVEASSVGERGETDEFSHLTCDGEFVPLGPVEDPVESETWALLAQARALLAWNRATAHCPDCGGPTAAREGGHERLCLDPQCGKTHFPRTDPAVIARVLSGDRCLLARSRRFRPGLRSVIAGFVEPGESLESAVRREIGEEVGLDVDDVRYLGSQPWPFPMSLMIAFEAHALSKKIRIDEDELEAADWYTRNDVRKEIASGHLSLPSRKSIARRMIDGWMSGEPQI